MNDTSAVPDGASAGPDRSAGPGAPPGPGDDAGGDPTPATAQVGAAPEGAPREEPPAGTSRRRARLPVVLAAVAVVVIAADQATKVWAVAALSGRGPLDVVDGLVRLDLTRNSGAAFSFATGATWIFTVIATAVSVIIVRIARRLGSAGWAVALGLLLGGAVGNLIDRLVRAPGFALGHVVDFIELPHYPVFNVADSCIVTAAVLIALLGLRGIGVDGTRSSG